MFHVVLSYRQVMYFRPRAQKYVAKAPHYKLYAHVACYIHEIAACWALTFTVPSWCRSR